MYCGRFFSEFVLKLQVCRSDEWLLACHDKRCMLDILLMSNLVVETLAGKMLAKQAASVAKRVAACRHRSFSVDSLGVSHVEAECRVAGLECGSWSDLCLAQ